METANSINSKSSIVTNNKIIKNGANDALGGGIRIGVDNFTITNTTIANNTALSQGGGLWVGENSKGSITNSTLSGNKADDGQGNGLGGAIAFINGSNPVSVTNTTITLSLLMMPQQGLMPPLIA